jgi:hypothetical protein
MQLVHVTGVACASCVFMHMRLTMNGILNDFLHKGDSQLELIYCGWINRNKKLSIKEKIFFFINAHLLPKLPPKLWLMKLM